MYKVFRKQFVLLISFLYLAFALPFCKTSAEKVETDHKPKVSIIVPVYKVEPWLRECMDSLVNQTLKDIEIICVDDGSPDNCGKILDEYAENDKRVKVIHQQNMGCQKARNAGLDIAMGEYITFVDPDDYVEKETYETAYNYAKKDDLDILNFGYRQFNDGQDNHINHIDFSDSKVVSVKDYVRNYIGTNIYTVWAKIYKSQIIQKDKIRFDPQIRPSDDTCFTLMTTGRANRIKKIPAKFYNYRIRKNSITWQMTRTDWFFGSYNMIKKICEDWRKSGNLKGKEDCLLEMLINWCSSYSVNLQYAQEILNQFGSDIINEANVKKCPEYIKNHIKRLEYSAASNKKPPIENGIYQISAFNGRCLDIPGGSKNNGKNLQVWKRNGGISQNFEITKQPEGYYKIKACCSDKLLDSKNAKTIKQFNRRNRSNFQNWYIIPCGNNSFNIISANNLLAMDISGRRNICCTNLSGANSQKFKFIKK